MIFRNNELWRNLEYKKSLSMFNRPQYNIYYTIRDKHHKILGVSGHQQLNLFVIGAYGTKEKHKLCLL